MIARRNKREEEAVRSISLVLHINISGSGRKSWVAVEQAITWAGGGQATKAVSVSGAAVVCWAGGRLQEVATHAAVVVVVARMTAVWWQQ